MYYHHKKRDKASRFVHEVAHILEGKNPKSINSRKAFTHQSRGVELVVEHKTFGKGVILKEEGNMFIIRFMDGTQRSFLKDICENQNLIWVV